MFFCCNLYSSTNLTKSSFIFERFNLKKSMRNPSIETFFFIDCEKIVRRNFIMLRYLTLLISSLLIVGCGKNNTDETSSRFHEDGRGKPSVAITTIIDSTAYDIPWSMSDELTTSLRLTLCKKNSLYVPSKDQIDQFMSFSNNPFEPDVSWMKNSFGNNEFVVFVEILEHENVVDKEPSHKWHSPICQSVPTNLQSVARIRIIDLRGDVPQIVLQETIKDTFYISKNLIPTDYNKITWGGDHYSSTPLAMAHEQLVGKISERVDDYILLARSR